ncbi:hypothetical protein ANCCAN_23097 [Ancylostoma caninum]|uniref:Uncharacterized protein n=1 Tax=Ancylostoma caninum TaxID=29170 RepID=A0A368FLT0_ANCCA|nr:hypothetical protein ANCCAN_23097 [Ancylostoma caninum]
MQVLEISDVKTLAYGAGAAVRVHLDTTQNSAKIVGGFRPAVENDIDFSGRSLVIFFSLATSMQQDFQSFRANLATMVNEMQASSNDIVSYVFYGFVLTNTNVLTYFIGGGRQLSSLNLIFDAIVFSPPAQQQPFLYQIMKAPFAYSNPVSFSNLLVFVDSGAGDATAPNDLFSANTPEQQLMSSVKIWHNKLTFIVTQTSANPIDTSGDDFDVYRRLAESTHGDLFVIDKNEIPVLTFIVTQTSANPIDTSGDDFDVYRRLAESTHGDLFVIDKNEIPVVMTTVLANYQHIMENLAVRYRFNCNEMKMFGIPAEYDTTSQIRVLLTVDKNDGNPLAFERPYVTDMNNLELSYTSRGRYYALYDLPNAVNNIRVVSITPGLVCSLRVFFASANTMLLSHMNNPKMDIGFPVAYKNIPQLASGRPVGFSNFDYVEIRQFDSRTGFPLSVSTRGYRRGGDSTYTYEFDNLSDCNPGPFIQQVEIYYQDGVATRALPGYCALPGPPAASNRRVMTAKSDVGDNGSQCAEMNLNAITDPRQHEFRQIVFAVENSAAMNNAAFILAQNIDMIIAQMNKGKPERQFSLILFDDKDIRFVSSTYDADLFLNQFSDGMLEVMNNKITLPTSRSFDVVAKVPEISILSPTILYLFTSSSSAPSAATTNLLTRNLQVNVFTMRDGSNVLINDDLTYHQRSSGGRNLPVTSDGLPNLQDLLTSSLYENSIVLDKVAQDCSASVSFKFNVEDVATAMVINVVGLDVETANMVLFSDPNVDTLFDNWFYKISGFSGNHVNVVQYQTYVDRNTVTFSIDPRAFAYWTNPWSLSVKTTAGPCFVQVTSLPEIVQVLSQRMFLPSFEYNVDEATKNMDLVKVRVVSPITVIPGFTANAAVDFPEDSPFSNAGSEHRAYAVFHVPSTSYVVNQLGVSSASVNEPWLDSNGLRTYTVGPRDINSCSYQYISVNFVMPSSTLVRLEVYGSTEKNAVFQRTFYFEQLYIYRKNKLSVLIFAPC